MEPISSKYYFDGKCFKLRSQWPKRVRIALATAFVAYATTFTYDISHARFNIFSTPKNKLELYVEESNPKAEAKAIVSSAIRWAQEFQVDEKLILAVAKVESNFQKHAISGSGAYGVMQVIPVWHKSKILEARNKLGNPELFNINTNVYLGTWVLRDCLANNSNINKALLCYSGQTAGYDKKVLSEYREIQRL